MKITYIGYNHVHDSDFYINRPLGSGDYLALLIKSPALFSINGTTIKVDPNTFFLYKEGTSQCYRASGTTFSNDWFHFEMTDEDKLYLENLKIPYETPIAIKDIESYSMLLNNINIEQYSNNKYKENTINCYMHIFFNKISEAIQRQGANSWGKNYDKFSLLRAKIYNRPYLNWTIENLSHQICLSPYYFQRLYKKHFGITCMSDVINARVDYAKQQLCTTKLSIRHIAEQCGYENDVHFMRQFKQITGLSPTQYRQSQFSDSTTFPAIKQKRIEIF